MNDLDNTIGIIFKNLGEHQFRIDDFTKCINNHARCINELDSKIKILAFGFGATAYLTYRILKNFQAEIEELKQAKGV
jgi:hypothetical protein